MDAPIVTLKRGRARPFWFGCPIVFSGAVESVAGNPAPGALVQVLDAEGRPVGHGFFNPASAYRVRIVRLERPAEPSPDPGAIIDARIRQALALRAALGLPSADTTAWRLLNSEGDALSGLTVDVFDRTVVAQASALWAEVHRDRITESLRAALGADVRVVHRISSHVRREEGLGAQPAGDAPPVEVLEGGLRYEVDVRQGQKTGFYIDQRENRARVRAMAAGRRVLDAYCFTGGFSLAAAAGGAAEVLGIDSSAPAIEGARRAAAANGLGKARFEVADAVEALQSRGRWDLVICDPPKLAGGRSELEAALMKYKRVNRAAIEAVEPGGLLVTCSCSSVVRRDLLIEVIRDAATEAGRRVSITSVLGAAPDHPIHPSWPEGEYLKCVVAGVW